MSDTDWESPSDPDSRIARMKDGTTHLACKAEQAVDLKAGMILSATVCHANAGDTQTPEATITMARECLEDYGSQVRIRGVAADKGYHSAETLATFAGRMPSRLYIPEPRRPAGRERVWADKPENHRKAVDANLRRTRGNHSKRLQRLRSERVGRSFANICETGGARRTMVRGIEGINRRYGISAMAHNLGRLMRALPGVGSPRGWTKALRVLFALLHLPHLHLAAIWMPQVDSGAPEIKNTQRGR